MKSIVVSLLAAGALLSTTDSFSPPLSTYTRTAAPLLSKTLLRALEVDATSEVVGGHGRIGSLFLREYGAIAVPRGVAPGCLTNVSAPIIVAVNAKEWNTVFYSTPPRRRDDLVWVGDGLLSQSQEDSTVVVPHLNVYRVGADPVISPDSPPTYVFGKHAAATAAVLTKRGVNVSMVEAWTDICRLAAQRRQADRSASTIEEGPTPTLRLVPIPAIDLICCGQPKTSTNNDKIQSAIVVGGGIIGSSIARALSQRGISKITVYDPTSVGTTTPASWAWLNANSKPPHHYRSFNQLGLRGWRIDPLLKPLPTWTGTLVRTKEDRVLRGGYSAEGPLGAERIQELEPEANFTGTDEGGNVYYYADEGHVDPHEAVGALRRDAADNGVTFVRGERVVGLVRDNKERVVGVQVTSMEDGNTIQETLADVVIVAAGANSSDAALGGVPLVHNPSRTYFATPRKSARSLLKRTLLDTVQQLYIAQRKDGTFVAGGGALKFGLSSTSDEIPPEEATKQMIEAQALSQTLAPNPIRNSLFTHKEEAIKPMPEDGYPILGYLEAGLYSAVTHSGMTLAPLIGQLVAAEVREGVSLSVLDDYRPSRFDHEGRP